MSSLEKLLEIVLVNVLQVLELHWHWHGEIQTQISTLGCSLATLGCGPVSDVSLDYGRSSGSVGSVVNARVVGIVAAGVR